MGEAIEGNIITRDGRAGAVRSDKRTGEQLFFAKESRSVLPRPVKFLFSLLKRKKRAKSPLLSATIYSPANKIFTRKSIGGYPFFRRYTNV
ncbi:hypothetical protein UNH65_31050 [Chitinophaga sp. 180180018-2]|nr:hypothetical protein [Chitinophaga sp. 212800010-3]